MKDMHLGEMNAEDLVEMTSKKLDEVGDEIEDKRHELEDMGKKKLADLGKKLEKMGE
ncbi:hypothetical protein [Clostridium aminobutyricum]|uniref:Uncharacterized protein n=1 Tax=Clostridium aminobutyricum TaxID=33953 RepID=A0A939D6X5_CLOAM|nr:hypothetical protein [Clostridium aminobutyricum]MBN7772190.1 hypothetical protein [Clostridium aminobutyricum]